MFLEDDTEKRKEEMRGEERRREKREKREKREREKVNRYWGGPPFLSLSQRHLRT